MRKNDNLKRKILSVFGKSVSPCHGRGVNNPVTDALLRLLDSFLLTVTCKGQIVLVSPSIEQHMGHCQVFIFKIKIFVCF